MIRFVEMNGIYIDQKKSFGFYNTITDSFIRVGGTYVFDTIDEFNSVPEKEFKIVDKKRLQSLISKDWLNNKEDVSTSRKLDININGKEEEKLTKVEDCSTKLIEQISNCNISKNHTHRWGVIFGNHSRTYHYMNKDKEEVLKWIQKNYDNLLLQRKI